jgi:hypothetical protein
MQVFTATDEGDIAQFLADCTDICVGLVVLSLHSPLGFRLVLYVVAQTSV